MTNPYESPKSRIEPDEKPEGSKIGWKLFFGFYLLMQIWGMFDAVEVFLAEGNSVSNIVDLVTMFSVYILATIAIYGYAFNKKFLDRIKWKILLLFVAVSDSLGMYLDFEEIFASAEDNAGLLLFVIVILVFFLFFQYWALYNYAYANKAPWKK